MAKYAMDNSYDYNHNVGYLIAKNPNTSTETLNILASHWLSNVRLMVINNPNVSEKTINKFVKANDCREGAAARKRKREMTKFKLTTDKIKQELVTNILQTADLKNYLHESFPDMDFYNPKALVRLSKNKIKSEDEFEDKGCPTPDGRYYDVFIKEKITYPCFARCFTVKNRTKDVMIQVVSDSADEEIICITVYDD